MYGKRHTGVTGHIYYKGVVDAQVENATFVISRNSKRANFFDDKNIFVFEGGIWKSGIWHRGYWRGGIWESGEWKTGKHLSPYSFPDKVEKKYLWETAKEKAKAYRYDHSCSGYHSKTEIELVKKNPPIDIWKEIYFRVGVDSCFDDFREVIETKLDACLSKGVSPCNMISYDYSTSYSDLYAAVYAAQYLNKRMLFTAIP